MSDESWERYIQLLLEEAIKSNANLIKAAFHRCETYDGWCVEISVRKHEACDE